MAKLVKSTGLRIQNLWVRVSLRATENLNSYNNAISCIEINKMLVKSAKLIGRGAATISLVGAGTGVVIVFASLVMSIARNPALLKQLFTYALLGFALTERNRSIRFNDVLLNLVR
jgi:F-type H+-transporting ATPase subunit c